MDKEDLSIFSISYNTVSHKANEVNLPLLKKDFKAIRQKSHNEKLAERLKSSTAASYRPRSLGFKPKFKLLVKVASPISYSKVSKIAGKTGSLVSSFVDWKTSPLETQVLNKRLEFNSERDSSLLTEYQIMNMREPIPGLIPRNILKNTLKLLSMELVIPQTAYEFLPDSSLLFYCQSLLSFRSLTITLIKSIHSRERSMLRLITDSTCNKQEIREKFMQFTFSVIRQIKLWKKNRHSGKQFIYDGQNYMEKIHKDLVFLETSLISNK